MVTRFSKCLPAASLARAGVVSLVALGIGMAAIADPAHAQGSGAGSQFELTFWQSVSSSEDKAQYEAYLAKYPNGTFASLAKVKISALERNSAGAPPISSVRLWPRPACRGPALRVPVQADPASVAQAWADRAGFGQLCNGIELQRGQFCRWFLDGRFGFQFGQFRHGQFGHGQFRMGSSALAGSAAVPVIEQYWVVRVSSSSSASSAAPAKPAKKNLLGALLPVAAALLQDKLGNSGQQGSGGSSGSSSSGGSSLGSSSGSSFGGSSRQRRLRFELRWFIGFVQQFGQQRGGRLQPWLIGYQAPFGCWFVRFLQWRLRFRFRIGSSSSGTQGIAGLAANLIGSQLGASGQGGSGSGSGGSSASSTQAIAGLATNLMGASLAHQVSRTARLRPSRTR